MVVSNKGVYICNEDDGVVIAIATTENNANRITDANKKALKYDEISAYLNKTTSEVVEIINYIKLIINESVK
jgi:hypothetical protein